MKILISGGHLTPALALLDYITEHQPTDQLVFVGRIYSRKQNAQIAKEKEEVEKRGVRFIAFDSGKFSNHNPVILFVNALLFISGFLHALKIIIVEKPTVYVSFGSYLSIPLAFACRILQVPIIAHEQTRTVGFANSIVGAFATKVAISFPESAKHFPKNKIVLTGNLLRKKVLAESQNKPEWFTSRSEKKILYVTGGSQGSEIINSTLSQLMKWLITDWIVIHQCGVSTTARNYNKELEKVRGLLGSQAKQQYFVREWISEEELSWIYTHASAAITRGGANTLLELQVVGLPSIVIPLPFSHNNEQLLSAKSLSDTGKAILLPQKELSPATLQKAILELQKRYSSLKKALATDIPQTAKADEKLYDVIASVTKNN